MTSTDDRDYGAMALIDGQRLCNQDIRDHELVRARHALAYLKSKLGNDAMRKLLASDLREMQAQVCRWVEASNGAWQNASLLLDVPGPGAQVFQDWYTDAMTRRHEPALRAGHPEHFLSHPNPEGIEVIENIGETDLPWQVFYQPLPEDFSYPIAWDTAYSLHYGMEILDADGLRVGFSMRQSIDQADGLRLHFTTLLPAAAPPELVHRHLQHFAIEFRNWTRAAWFQSLEVVI